MGVGVDGCRGGWVKVGRSNWVGVGVFVFCLHSHPIPATQPPTPLDYTQISNNSIGLESIQIIQFYLKI